MMERFHEGELVPHELQKRVWLRSQKCESVNCVEVAEAGSEILIRDSRDPGGVVLRVRREDWDVFAAGVAAGDFRFS